MGVYIECIDKPETCGECAFEVLSMEGTSLHLCPSCFITDELVEDDKLSKNCPLRECWTRSEQHNKEN